MKRENEKRKSEEDLSSISHSLDGQTNYGRRREKVGERRRILESTGGNRQKEDRTCKKRKRGFSSNLGAVRHVRKKCDGHFYVCAFLITNFCVHASD